MPHWTDALIEPAWPKEHAVSLKSSDEYDRAAQRDGSNQIQRHRPLADAGGPHGRLAGTSGVHEEPHSDENKTKPGLGDTGQWREALRDASKVVTVRDVKNAVPECVFFMQFRLVLTDIFTSCSYKTVYPKVRAHLRLSLREVGSLTLMCAAASCVRALRASSEVHSLR